MKLLIIVFPIFFFIGCSVSSSSKKKKKEDIEYNRLIALEKNLVKTDLTINIVTAKNLYNGSTTFIKQYPKSKNKEHVLVLAAKSSDGLNMIQENIALIDELLKDFSSSENAPNYLYNKGKIFEEKIKDLEKAKLIYRELIQKYPKSELALSMKSYLLFLEKSETEQLEYLKQ